MKVRQNATFLTTLVSSVADGETIPAGMQRPYVWSEADVLALCDSLSMRFPVGGILTWKPPARLLPGTLSKPRLGPILPSRERHATRLILDGQNRLATLAWIIAGHDIKADVSDASPQERKTWIAGRELVYNWHSRSFMFMEPLEAERSLTLPARAFLGLDARLVRENWDRWEKHGHYEEQADAFIATWDELTFGFRDSRIIETCIEDASPAEAKHAFIRVCRTGVPMSEEDFDKALAWLPDPA